MPALTSIAVGLLVASAVVGVASVATTIIGAKTGNKTLQKIGKISGYVSMGLGVASLGVGAWASMAATTASTQVAAQTATQTTEQAVAKGATEIGKSAATTTITQGAGATTPVATGSVTPVAAAGVQPVATGGVAPAAATVTGTTGAATPTVTAGDVATTAVTEGSNVAKDVMASRMVAAPPVDRTPGIMNIGSEVGRVQPVTPAEGLSSYIPGWLKDLGSKTSEGLTEAKDFTKAFAKDNPMATYGIIATVGSGLSGLFEADVEDRRLKQQQQQFQAIQDRQDRATYI